MRDIKNIVKRLVKKYATNDPQTIINELNIKIIDYPFPENINGIYFSLSKHKFIMINDSIYGNIRKIVLAHELAHYILHKECNHIFFRSNTFYNVGKLETEADHFVLELLFNSESFDEFGVSNNILSRFYNLKYGF